MKTKANAISAGVKVVVLLSLIWLTTEGFPQGILLREEFDNDPVQGGRFIQQTAGTESSFVYQPRAGNLAAVLDVDLSAAHYLSQPFGILTESNNASFSVVFRVDSVDDQELDPPSGFIGLVTDRHVNDYGDGLTLLLAMNKGALVANANIDATTNNPANPAIRVGGGSEIGLKTGITYLAVGRYDALARLFSIEIYQGQAMDQLVGFSTAVLPPQTTLRLNRLGLQNCGAKKVDRGVGSIAVTVDNLFAPAQFPNRIMIEDARDVAEGDPDRPNAAVFRLRLWPATSLPVSVHYQTADQSARAGLDYQARSGVVTFPPGQSEATLSVPIVPDRLYESNKTFLVLFDSPANATLENARAAATIQDDDPPPTLQIADVTVDEGNEGFTEMIFDLSLSEPSGRTVTLSYQTRDDSAKAGLDYEAIAGTVELPPGCSHTNLTVRVITDTIQEPLEESFLLVLTSWTGASVSQSTARGTIRDDDWTPWIRIADAAPVAEGPQGTTTNAVFPVTLSRAFSKDVWVSYAVADGKGADALAVARVGVDVQAASGQLRFAPGVTRTNLWVTILGNNDPQSDRSFRLLLFNPINAAIATTEAVGWILDDDPKPVLSVADAQVVEGDSGFGELQFAVSLDKPSKLPVSAHFDTTGVATATNEAAVGGRDFVSRSDTVVIPANQRTVTVAVRTFNNLLDEPDRALRFALDHPTNAVLGRAEAVGVILDNDPPPSILGTNVNVAEGDQGTRTVSLPLWLSAPSGRAVSVSLATEGGTATSGTDFQPLVTSVVFPPGTTNQNVFLGILGDTIYEDDETCFLVLSHAENATLPTNRFALTIANDDSPPVVSVSSVTNYEGNTGQKAFVFVVTVIPASGKGVSVDYRVSNGAAVVGADYLAAAGTLTFAPGQTSKPVSVQVLGDAVVEPDEDFRFELSNPVGATLGVASARGWILNDDLPQLSIRGASLTEPEPGLSISLPFQITLSPVSEQTVTVSFHTVDGAAHAGTDYVPTNGVLRFAPGETTRQIGVAVRGDLELEGDESFTMVLADAANAALSVSEAAGIVRDRPPPQLAISDAAVWEGGAGTRTNALFSVSLSAVSSQLVTVNYSTVGGTARDGLDYLATNGVLRFAPGETSQTIAVIVLGDDQPEGPETFKVLLSEPQYALVSKAEGVGTILEPSVVPSLSIQAALVAEPPVGGMTNAVFLVSLSRPATQDVTVAYATVDGTATSGKDYGAAQGVLRFTPGQTNQSVAIPVYGDGLPEGIETFHLQLTNPIHAQLAAWTASATILDRPPELSIGDSLTRRGAPNTWTGAVFTVSLSAPSAQEVTVVYNTVDGTARAGIDYQATNGMVRFAPGQTNQPVVVWVAGGTADVTNLEFAVALSQPTGALLRVDRGRGVIWSVGTPPKVRLVSPGSVLEGGTGATVEAVLQVTLSEVSPTVVRVHYTTVDGTARAGEDYEAQQGDLEFAPGEQSKKVRVTVYGDLRKEGDETFSLQLSQPVGATLQDVVGWVTVRDYVPDLRIVAAGAQLTQEGYEPANGLIEPLEAVEVEFALRNLGSAHTVQLEVQLLSDGGTVTPLSGAQAYGVLTAGGPATARAFRFQVNGRGGAPFEVRLRLRDGDWDLGYVTNRMTLGPQSDLTLRAAGTPETLVVGERLRYTLVITNAGPSAASGLALSGALGNGLEVLSVDAGPGAWTNQDQTLTVGRSELPVGEVWLCTIEGVPRRVPADGQLISYFGVKAVEYDSRTADNKAAVITEVTPPMGLYLESVEVREGDTGFTNAVFLATLRPQTNRVVSVDWRTLDGSASSPADYTSLAGRLVFPPGVTRTNITVAVRGDTLPEGDEDFRVELSNPANALLATNVAFGIIRDDDTGRLTIDDPTIVRPAPGTTTQLWFTVSLSLPSPWPIRVAFETMDGTACAGLDYFAAGGIVNFAPGETNQTISVIVKGSDQPQDTESFQVVLRDPQNAIVDKPTGVGTLVTSVTNCLSVQGSSVLEPPPGGLTNALFTVRLTPAATQEVSVAYATVDKTASAGLDYGPTNGVLRFAPGQTQKTIAVAVYGDDLLEGDETFGLLLSDPSLAQLTAPAANATILDRAPLPGLSIGDTWVRQPAPSTLTAAVFAVSLSVATTQEVTVAYKTVDGTARAGVNYLATNGMVRFVSGQTNQSVVVWVSGGMAIATNLEFAVALSQPTGALLRVDRGRGVIWSLPTIPKVRLVSPGSVPEGGAGATVEAVIQVTLSEVSPTGVRVHYTTVDGTARAGEDYEAQQGDLEFAPGEQNKEVRVIVHGDLRKEGDETFSLQLSQPVGATLQDVVGWVTLRDYVPDRRIVAAGSKLIQESYEPADGFIEPQETVEVEFALRNLGRDDATQLQAQLVADAGAIIPLSGKQTYGLLTAGGPDASRTFRFQVNGRGGDPFLARLKVWDGDWDLGYVTNRMILGPQSELALQAAGMPQTVAVGEPLRLTVTVTNAGPSAASGLTLSGALGDGLEVLGVEAGSGSWALQAGTFSASLPALASGAQWRCALNTVPRRAPSDGQLISYFGVKATEYDSRTADNKTAVLTEVTPPVGGIYIQGAEVNEGPAGAINAVFAVTLNPPTNRIVTVDFRTRDGSATFPADYATNWGRLVFPPGVTRTNITVAVRGDTLREEDESFWVELSNPVNALLLTNRALGVIVDDDSRGLTIDDPTVAEPTSGAETRLRFTVSLSLPSPFPVRVAFATVDGTARAGLDYVATNGVLAFAPGETNRPIVVVVKGDDQAEGAESLKVLLSQPQSAVVDKAEGVGMITETGLVPALTVQDVLVDEPPIGSVANAVFTVSLNPAATQEVTVAYAAVDGTATAGLDYDAVQGTLRFAPGQTNATVAVPVHGDDLTERNETFQIRLNSPEHAQLGVSAATATIQDRILPPQLSIADASVRRGAPATLTGAVFTLSLSKASTQVVTVAYATADDSAHAARDYLATNGVVRFAPGETNRSIVVWVLGGPAETNRLFFSVRLTEALGAVLRDDQGQGTIWSQIILPQVQILTPRAVQEGRLGTTVNALFQVSLTERSSTAVRVHFATVDGTARAGEDYEAKQGDLEFAPGEQSMEVRVAVHGDLRKEGDENFALQLSQPVGATLQDVAGWVTLRDYAPDLRIVATGAQLTQESYEPTNGLIDPRETVEVEFALRNLGGEDTTRLEARLESDGGTITPLVGSQLYGVLAAGGAAVAKRFQFQVNGRGGDPFSARLKVWDGDWDLGYVTLPMTLGPQSELTLLANGSRPTLAVGERLRYTVSVTNTGPSVATGLTLGAVLAEGLEVLGVEAGAGTWTRNAETLTLSCAELPAGTEWRCAIDVVPRQVPADGQLIGYFAVKAAEYDSRTADNKAAVFTEVTPSVGIYIQGAKAREGDSGITNAVFTVTLNPQTNRVVTVDFHTLDGSASSPADYATNWGRLVFAPGVTATNISVAVRGDKLQEDDENFWVELSNPVNALLATNKALGVILDDDPPGISINDVTVNVGTQGNALASLDIRLSTASPMEITVDYFTENGSATSGDDYATRVGRLSFPPGCTRTNIDILIAGNTRDETTEYFFVTLINPRNATLAKGRGTVTIADEAPTSVAVGDVSVAEGDRGLTPAVFTLTLAASVPQPVSVQYSTDDDTAKAGVDYLPTNGTVVFAPYSLAAQVTVYVVGNTLFEPDKVFYLNLTNATLSRPRGVGTIRNDDPEPARTATLYGQVKDALNGQPLGGATIVVADLHTLTDADGRYLLTNVPPGALTADFDASICSGEAPLRVRFINYASEAALTVRGGKEAYYDYVNTRVQVRENESVRHDFSMSPILQGLRFVLNWGRNPRDLDAHLLTPHIEGTAYEIYYWKRGTTNGPPYANLDVDDIDSYGPETVTISDLQPGWYRYFVHNYMDDQGDTGPLRQSAAVVQVYNERGLIRTINAPTAGEGVYWDVCAMNGTTAELTLLNRLQSTKPTNGPMDSATSVAGAEGQPSASPSEDLRFEWDFGNGIGSADYNPQATYLADGLYDVTLTVSTRDQKRASLTRRGFIQIGSALVLNCRREADGIVLDWQAGPPAVRLESAVDLASPQWTPVALTPTGPTNRLSIAFPTKDNRFFRLRKVE